MSQIDTNEPKNKIFIQFKTFQDLYEAAQTLFLLDSVRVWKQGLVVIRPRPFSLMRVQKLPSGCELAPTSTSTSSATHTHPLPSPGPAANPLL